MPAPVKQGLDKLHGGLLLLKGLRAPRVLWSVRVGLLLCLSALGYAGAASRQRLRDVGWCAVMAPVAIQVLASWEWLLIAVCFSCPCYVVFPHPWPATAVGWFLPVGTSGHGVLRPALALVSSSTWTRPGYCSLPG